jgi:hypothetical protein
LPQRVWQCNFLTRFRHQILFSEVLQCQIQKVRLSRPCVSCGEPAAFGQRKYCSFRCQQDYQFRIRAIALENGSYRAYNCNGFIRKYLIRKLGECCFRCGWNERHPKTGRVPVEVENIDGNWKNNRPDNLTLLCPNCHSLTDTYRALNRGRGRAKRFGGRSNPQPTKPLSKATRSKIARLPGIISPGQNATLAQLSLLPPT